MRALLVWPDSRNEVLGWGDLGAIAEPLALEYLAAALREDGHEPRILDLRLHRDALDEALREFRPDLVAVTAFSMHVRRAKEICAIAKRNCARVRTVVGGHHATFLPEDFFTPDIDFVVVGEGCGPIRAVARPDVPVTPGLWRRTAEGHRLDAPGKLIDAMAIAAMPTPARDLTQGDRARYFIDWMRPVALLRTSIGCPYRCSFCSIWRAAEGLYIDLDIERVVAELATIDEEWVFLIDDEAFINGKRMLRLADAIERAGIRKRLFTYCRIDTLIRNRAAIARWQEIGLERLFIGIDAISRKDLDEYNKKCEVAQIEQGLRIAHELGIEVFAQFVVNSDYAGADFDRLVRFIEHHRITYPSFTVLTPLPGTDMLSSFEHVSERQPDGRPNWDLFDCQNAVVETRLPHTEFRRRYRDLYRVFKGAYAEYREHKTFIDDRFSPLADPQLKVAR